MPLISLAFLFLLVFHIPHDSGERMGFGVTILLSITVYLLVISEKLPEKSNDKPMLGICFIVVFYILCAALAAAAATTILAKRKSKPPKFLTRLYESSCIKRCKREKKQMNISPAKLDNDTVIEFKEVKRGEVKNKDDEDDKDYNPEWQALSRYMDQKLFYIFNILIIIVPLFTILSLPTTGYGG